jgi:hypothetical protein
MPGHEEHRRAEAHPGVSHLADEVFSEGEGQRPAGGSSEQGSPPALACPSPSTTATDGATSLDEALALVRLPAGALHADAAVLPQEAPRAKQARLTARDALMRSHLQGCTKR